MTTLVDGAGPARGARWLATLASLVAAAVSLSCGGGSGAPAPQDPGTDPRTPVAMPPTAPGDPSASWLGATPAALVADPGPDRTVPGGVHVILDGTRSASPTGAITAWSWVQVAGSTVTLTGADSARPELDTPPVTEGSAQLAFELTVHDGTGLSTTATHRVLVLPPEPATSLTGVGLVRRAMQDGSLDRDTAAQYLAFAAFGDPRLPAPYRGAGAERGGSWAMAVLGEEYATLSPPAQAVVLPFLLAPGHPARVAAGLDDRPAALAMTEPVDATRRAAGPGVQASIQTDASHVAVWFWTGVPDAFAKASSLFDQIELKIWPALEGLWGDHLPILADGGVGAAFRGTHGKLNIFLDPASVDSRLTGYGYTQAYGRPPAPAYVVLRAGLPLSGNAPPGLFQTAAHELTHACQYSYFQTETMKQRAFLYEATATWAEDDIYSGVNSEHEMAQMMMDYPLLPLDEQLGDHAYGAYLFFQWYTRSTGDRSLIPRAFDNFGRMTSLDAVEAAFPSVGGMKVGFEQRWGDFMEALWNGHPRTVFQSDGLTRLVKEEPLHTLAVGPTGDVRLDLKANVLYLASTYHHVTVDPGVRTIHFYDGFTYPVVEARAPGDGSTVLVLDRTSAADLSGAATRLLVKRGGTWTSYGARSASVGDIAFCQDDPADRVDEIVVAFGNSLPARGTARTPKKLEPVLWATNIGCNRWRGTVTAATSPSRGAGPQESLTVNDAVFGRYRIPGVFAPGVLEVKSGAGHWSIAGSDTSGCTYEGAASFPVGPGPGGPGGILTFATQVLGGGTYRTYEAAGSSTTKVMYTMTCTGPDGRPEVTTYEKNVEWLSTASAGAPAWRPTVSVDGGRAAGTADDGVMEYTWDFRREP